VISTTSGLKMAVSEISSYYSVGVLRSLCVIYNIFELLHSLVVGGDVISGYFSAVLNLLRVCGLIFFSFGSLGFPYFKLFMLTEQLNHLTQRFT